MSKNTEMVIDLNIGRDAAKIIRDNARSIERFADHFKGADVAVYRAICDSIALHSKHLIELIDNRLP